MLDLSGWQFGEQWIRPIYLGQVRNLPCRISWRGGGSLKPTYCLLVLAAQCNKLRVVDRREISVSCVNPSGIYIYIQSIQAIRKMVDAVLL